jgi:SAM-dependent methyltransferase
MSTCIACGLTIGYPGQFTFVAHNRFFEGLVIQQCPQCGLIMPSARPHQMEIQRFYGNTYYRYNWLARWAKKRIGDLFANSRMAWIDQCMPVGRRAKVLEIGCGYGNLLALLAENGAFCEGVEPSMECHEHRMMKPLFPMYKETFEGFKSPLKYDLIVLSHVLEHLTYPEDAIEKLKGMLAPGGWLYLEVPNRHAPTYKNSDYQDVPDFWFFDRDSFEMFLKKHGLTGQVFNMEVNSLWGRYDKVGCAVSWPWLELVTWLGWPLLYRGNADSFTICAIVRGK